MAVMTADDTGADTLSTTTPALFEKHEIMVPSNNNTIVTSTNDTTTTTTSGFLGLKGRIKEHYDLLSEYYQTLWGEHIHHGYFTSPTETKEHAQCQLIELLLSKSQLSQKARVLDVGCGIGGTTRYLAREKSCEVTGITISDEQVRIATKISKSETETQHDISADGFITLRDGKVRFIELDAEKMGEYFTKDQAGFDAVWISEAMSHLPQKQLFFDNAFKLLKSGGKLVIADWFKADGLTEEQMKSDIKPIEDGMLLPPLCSQTDYISHAQTAGFKIFAEPFDISENVKKTWDISLSLVAKPSLWAMAIAQGRDFIQFLRAFQAMRTGYSNKTFRYAVMVFQKE